MIKWDEWSTGKKVVLLIIVVLSVAAIGVGIWLATKPKGDTEEERKAEQDKTSKGSTALWLIIGAIGVFVFIGLILSMWSFKSGGRVKKYYDAYRNRGNNGVGESDYKEVDGRKDGLERP
jgi:flagellar basal body-associated protein FliL